MKTKSFKTMCLIGAVLAVCGSVAKAAETLILKNGDRISGVMTSSGTEGAVSLQTPYGTIMHIPVTQIKAVQSGSGQVQAEVVMDESDTEAALENPSNIEPAAGIKDNNPDKYEWSGRINVGGFVDDGNSNKKALTGDAEVTARNHKNRWIAGGDVNFANDEGVETENNQSLYAEYNRFMGDKWFVGLRQEFEIDKVETLDLRSKTGPFVGYQFFEQEDLNLKVRLGGNYIYEDYENGNREEDAAAAWALGYDQTFMEGTFTAFHNHELDVPVDPTSAFILQSETGVRVPVAKNLTGTAQVDFDWDNEPAPGIQEEDTKYSVKLGYEW